MLDKNKKKELYKRLSHSGLIYSWDSETDVISIVVDDRLSESYDLHSYRVLNRAYDPGYEALLINKSRKHSIFVSTKYDELSEEDDPLYALTFYSMHNTWRREEWANLVSVLKYRDNVTICLSMVPGTAPDYNIVTDAFFTSVTACKNHLRSKTTTNKVCLNWEPATDKEISKVLNGQKVLGVI